MRTRCVHFLVAIFLIFSGVAQCQYPPELLQQRWDASWITAVDVPQRDAVVLHFRKEIDLVQKPKHFVVHVSADNQFLLYVNQRWVGFGPAHSDLAHWRYETYDLAPFLNTGKNIVAATVWNFGILTPLSQISDRMALVLQGSGATESTVNTDESWQVEQEKGIRVLPTPDNVRNKYYVSEPAEQINGNAFDWNWDAESGSGTNWKKALALQHASLQGGAIQNDNWQLVADPLPTMELKLEPAGKVVRAEGVEASNFPEKSFTVPPHSKVAVLLDRSHLTTAYPELTLSGGKGASVRFTYAEALFDDKGLKGNRNEIAGKHIEGIIDEFIADGTANRTFIPLAWKTWRYLQLNIETADEPLLVDKLQTWFTAYPFEERGYFHSDDASLKPIWDISWRTARLDAHDTYMDTPYYERMQYVGDTRIQVLISYAVGGDDRLPRQAIQAFNDSRISDGITRSRYPSSVRQIIPTFSLMWVGMVHDFWMYRNDPEFVRAQLEGTRSVLDWFLKRQNADGLLGKVEWWPFVDWGKDFTFGIPPRDKDGESSVITMQFIEALRDAADLESSVGETHRAEMYRSAADRAATAVYKSCWNSQYGLLADMPSQKHFSQHANILGVWLDVIPKDQQKTVLAKILSTSDSAYAAKIKTLPAPLPGMTAATYYFRFYLARALEHAGMGDDYLRLLDPWHHMVDLGLTTWAEQPDPTRSDSHAWSAHPDYDLLTIVGGIRPKSSGFNGVTIEPHLGALKHVSAGMPTPKGMVEAEYNDDGSGVEADITLPGGLPGELLWKGKSFKLHEGKQELNLPAQ